MEQFMDNLWPFVFFLLHEFPRIYHELSKIKIYEPIRDLIQWQFVFFLFSSTRISKNKSRIIKNFNLWNNSWIIYGNSCFSFYTINSMAIRVCHFSSRAHHHGVLELLHLAAEVEDFGHDDVNAHGNAVAVVVQAVPNCAAFLPH